MPSSLSARDSPRTQHARRRLARGQLVRSGSLFGTLKNLVTAPLAWLSSQDDFEDTPGKRRRAAKAVDRDDGSDGEDRPTTKRKRVDSPEPAPAPAPPTQPTRPTQGYLDVPEDLIPKQTAPRQRLTAPASNIRSSSFTPSLSMPAMQQEAHLARRTASPTISTSYSQPAAIQRTQSMDPPAYRAISLSRDVSMEGGLAGSASRDVTMSPTRQTPFQLRSRSSLTPQPSSQTFGPTPHLKGRDASEPPPLAALITNPVFVKPPSQFQHSQLEQPYTTLGSLAESKGHAGRPLRQHSTLFIGARPGSLAESSSTPLTAPVNAAEKALHDLDVYKTPLLPSRLRGSQTIPDMFKPKKAHAPVLMRSERERKPRLGTSEKLKDAEQATAAKPYAGRSGMKKMLEKRKLEEQEERERERASAIETDQDEEVEASHNTALEPAKHEEVAEIKRMSAVTMPPAETAVSARPTGGREQSSLRVGRTRTSRNHIARPVSKARNRFSAAFEDEGEDVLQDEVQEQKATEEPKKLPTLFESPKGFTFAQEPPTIQDSSHAKEPPIPVLPFSLTKPSIPNAAPSAAFAQPFSFAEPPKAAQPESPPAKPQSAPAAPSASAATSTIPSVPSISLVPSSPAPSKPETSISAGSAAGTTSAIPNFFANSSIFSKPTVNIPPPTAPSNTSSTVVEGTTTVESATAQSGTTMPFSFGGVGTSTPSPFGNATQSASQKKEPAKEEAKSPAAPSLFGNGSSSSPFSLGTTTSVAASTSGPSFLGASTAESKDDDAARSASSFFSSRPALPAPEEPKTTLPATSPAPATPALVPSSAPITFGTSAKPAEPAAPSPSPFSFGTSSPSSATAPSATSPAPFTFGAQKAEPAKETENKALFGTGEPAKPSLFGAPASSPSPFGGSQPASSSTDTAPKSSFAFGQPTQSTTSASTIEAPKPLFPSTSTGGSGGFTFDPPAPSAPAAPATPAKSPFSFGAPPATPVNSATESKPTFTFGAPSLAPQTSAPTTLFGGPSTGSNGADVSNKPFTFGAPARPATPPKEEQEVRMEESPTRNGGMDVNGQEQQQRPSNGFMFGGPSGSSGISPFGQGNQSAASSFSFGVKTETKPETKPAAPFSFSTSTSSGGGFGFGQKLAESTQSPISPAPFGSAAPFGQASATSAPSAPAFTFGAPSAPSAGFGQATSSTPTSPSTFGQPAPFSFGTPTSATAPSNPFAFGSQPASPATSNAGLPQPPGSSSGPSFTFGQPSPATTQSPASPFGAAPPAPGGVSFTIGSAAPQPQAAGQRAIKKLPNRRGGRR
ncbi:hypothetical protein BD414DRAFT_136769 [Trametes punicea]|nr:hypothetical protein BD414DRAFT_136769 [Trametes punicea]